MNKKITLGKFKSRALLEDAVVDLYTGGEGNFRVIGDKVGVSSTTARSIALGTDTYYLGFKGNCDTRAQFEDRCRVLWNRHRKLSLVAKALSVSSRPVKGALLLRWNVPFGQNGHGLDTSYKIARPVANASQMDLPLEDKPQPRKFDTSLGGWRATLGVPAHKMVDTVAASRESTGDVGKGPLEIPLTKQDPVYALPDPAALLLLQHTDFYTMRSAPLQQIAQIVMREMADDTRSKG